MTASYIVECTEDGGIELPFYLDNARFYAVRSRNKEKLVILPEMIWCNLYDRLSYNARAWLFGRTTDAMAIDNRLYLVQELREFLEDDLLRATFYDNRIELKHSNSSDVNAHFNALVKATA